LLNKNKDKLIVGLFLGDDMALMFREKPQTDNIKNYIATNFNMQSKESINKDYASFCHYLIYNTDKSLEMGPDIEYKRLRY